jgi:hypothetical protein
MGFLIRRADSPTFSLNLFITTYGADVTTINLGMDTMVELIEIYLPIVINN